MTTPVPGRHAEAGAGGSSAHDATGAARPLLTVVRGAPTPEQLAAVLAVVSARGSGGGTEEATPVRSPWARPQLRPALTPGPGAWQASALPR